MNQKDIALKACHTVIAMSVAKKQEAIRRNYEL
jgi:hypothetical protein